MLFTVLIAQPYFMHFSVHGCNFLFIFESCPHTNYRTPFRVKVNFRYSALQPSWYFLCTSRINTYPFYIYYIFSKQLYQKWPTSQKKHASFSTVRPAWKINKTRASLNNSAGGTEVKLKLDVLGPKVLNCFQDFLR